MSYVVVACGAYNVVAFGVVVYSLEFFLSGVTRKCYD